MNIEGYDVSNLVIYIDGSNNIGGYNNLPRKKKKEFKKSTIYYDKDIDLVVINKGNRRIEIPSEKFFTDVCQSIVKRISAT